MPDPTLRARMMQTHPPLYFTDIAILLADRGWQIDRVTQAHPFDGHTDGFVVTDNNGIRCYWKSIQDLKLAIL